MVNTVDSQTIVDGPRNVVVKITVLSDGLAGELSDQIVVNFSDLSNDDRYTSLKIEKLEWDFTGFHAMLEFDATTDDEAWHLSEGEGFMDFERFGGIPDPESTGFTGDLVLTTTGFTASGDNGVLVLHCKKRNGSKT